ncbi:uncharacterized protein V6R79_010032 [Siganus canaliculatus]
MFPEKITNRKGRPEPKKKTKKTAAADETSERRESVILFHIFINRSAKYGVKRDVHQRKDRKEYESLSSEAT